MCLVPTTAPVRDHKITKYSTRWAKKLHTKLNRFSETFTGRLFSKFAKIPLNLIRVTTLPSKAVMSENKRQSPTNAVVDDKLQGSVATYLRCGGIINNHIKKDLLPNLPVRKNI